MLCQPKLSLVALKMLSTMQEDSMKPSTKNQVTGKLHEMKGKVKEKVGQITNNRNLEAEGVDEKLLGKVPG